MHLAEAGRNLQTLGCEWGHIVLHIKAAVMVISAVVSAEVRTAERRA